MLLINTSNLHVGGGVQVAASFLLEISRFRKLPEGLVVWASDEVDFNLRQMGGDVGVFSEYVVLNSNGLGFLFSALSRRLAKFDAVFTVFGPLYSFQKPAISLVGFAQPWIVYPDNEAYALMNWKERVITRVKFLVQAVFFRRADELVVELEHVKTALEKSGICPSDRIRVVYNCLSSIYGDPASWKDVVLPEVGTYFKMGFVGRNYLHKNTAIFPAIRRILAERHGIDLRFYVTFTEDEWAMCGADFKAASINVGSLSAAQCPSFYRLMDGVIFPSLLECFSATPLEAMAMERPLFASDRPFNRDVCGEFALYFDPVDPSSAAEVIASHILSKHRGMDFLRLAREHAFGFSHPKDRAEKYLGYLVQAANRVGH